MRLFWHVFSLEGWSIYYILMLGHSFKLSEIHRSIASALVFSATMLDTLQVQDNTAFSWCCSLLISMMFRLCAVFSCSIVKVYLLQFWVMECLITVPSIIFYFARVCGISQWWFPYTGLRASSTLSSEQRIKVVVHVLGWAQLQFPYCARLEAKIHSGFA